MRCPRLLALLVLFAGVALAAGAAPTKRVLLIAGAPSHGPGMHEHNAGMLLLQKCLAGVPGLTTEVALNGWPQSDASFEGVDAILIFSDGGRRHPALVDDQLSVLERALARGAGLGLLHYAVEPTLEKGHDRFLQWIGGAFEIHWSVNPHWDAHFRTLAVHPITRGVPPFTIRDEWYFNMRFVEGMRGVTPLLQAVPDESTVTRPDGPHSGNAFVRALVAQKEPVTVAWAYERPDGGRGFGFTGAHYHRNWGHEPFRKLALNAVLWLAKMEVPPEGVSSVVTEADLAANLDPKPARKAN